MKIHCPNPKCPYGKDGVCIRMPCVCAGKLPKKHKCAWCEEEKQHGCVCAISGVRGIHWVCFDCQARIEDTREREES